MATEGGLTRFTEGKWENWNHENGLGADYDLVKASLLLDAGRTAALAGDVQRAISVYESVVALAGEDDNAATEARFRMAELRRRTS